MFGFTRARGDRNNTFQFANLSAGDDNMALAITVDLDKAFHAVAKH
jgi:hypothetical protein